MMKMNVSILKVGKCLRRKMKIKEKNKISFYILSTFFLEMKGFSKKNIRSMRLFYEEYAFYEKWQQLVAKLPFRI